MKKLIALLLALVMVLGLVACAAKSETPAAEEPAAETPAAEEPAAEEPAAEAPAESAGDKTVVAKIAVAGPITGEYAEYGAHMVNGTQLAIDEWNAKGVTLSDGTKVTFELAQYDDAAKPDEAAAVAQQIVSDDSIIALSSGHFQSSVALSVCPTYQDAGILSLSNAASHPDYTKIGSYVVRNNITDEGEARNYIQMVYRMGYRKIAICGEESDFGVSTADSAAAALEDMKAAGAEVELVANEFFAANNDDYSAVISKLNAANPDVVICTGTYPQVAPLCIQAKQAGVEWPIMGCGNCLDDNLISVGGDALDGFCLVSLFNADTKNPIAAEFVQNYMDFCGKTPNHVASLTYDSASYIMYLVEQTGSIDREAIMKAAHEIPMEGVTGTILFDEDNECEKIQVVMEIKDGAWVEKEDCKLTTYAEFLDEIANGL